MRRSGRLFIVLGIALALVAGLLAFVALSGGDPDDTTSASTDQAEPREITVITAARDVVAHERLGEDDLQEEVVDASTVSSDVVTSRLEAIGLAYSDDLIPGQALIKAQLESPGLANRIEPGRRAFALPVDAASLVGGLVRDEDNLDIVFNTRLSLLRINPSYPLEAPDNIELGEVTDPETDEDALLLPPYGGDSLGPSYPYPGEDGSRFWVSDMTEGDPSTKVVLQNVRVLRVVVPGTTEAGGAEEGGSFLVLDVSPEEAETLRFMVENGTYQVVLRGLEDSEIVTTDGETYNQMVDDLGLPVPKTVRLPAAGAQ
jgi:pilus assembly protein CpaB